MPVAFAKKAICGWEGKGEEREREKIVSSSYGVYVTIYQKKEKKREDRGGEWGAKKNE